MPAHQSTRWCFTINAAAGAQEHPCAIVWDPASMVYLIHGKEVAESTGRLHLQGFVVMKTKKSLTAMKRIHGTAHWESARGTSIQAAEYCRKEGDFEEHGDIPTSGQRTDLSDCVAALETRSLEELMEDPEHMQVIARHMPYFRQVSSLKRRRLNTAALKSRMESSVLRAWQQDLLEVVLADPHPRQVVWFHDSGNTGKSFFTDYCVALHNAVVFTGGKLADLAHAYEFQRIIIFDISRTKADCMNTIYEAIETFKNGRIFSPKYESQCKVFPIPHVICFANFEPDQTKLTADRWDIRSG